MTDTLICPTCGTSNPAGTRFCIGCGAGLVQASVPSTPAGVCPQCGTALVPGAVFCSHCGAATQSQNPIEPPRAAQRPNLPPPPPPPNQFYAVAPQRPTVPPVDPTRAPRLTAAPSYVRLGQVERPRGCYLTGLTTLGFFVTSVQMIAFMLLAAVGDLMPGFPIWYAAVNAFNNLICLIGFIGLYNWKKWGASVVIITLFGGLLISIVALLTGGKGTVYVDDSISIVLGLVTGITLLVILMVLAGVLPKWKYLE
ncbi:MAG TPA: zinc ribbon domain-containing protein [Longilinea sp.]|nr:zinc ribbon domain-containing protein [Longilinea sp.]